jgi:hypothetical protein
MKACFLSPRHRPIRRIFPSICGGYAPAINQGPSMSSPATTAEVARLRAEERFKKTALREREAAEARKHHEENRRAETAKVDRLRALRLARDAQQAEMAAQRLAEKRLAAETAAEQPVTAKRKRRSVAADTAAAES